MLGLKAARRESASSRAVAALVGISLMAGAMLFAPKVMANAGYNLGAFWRRAVTATAAPTYILATSYVPTAESTSSTTPVDLATPDQVTFTLTQSTTVIIEYRASIYKDGCTSTIQNSVTIDGTNDTTSLDWVALGGSWWEPSFLVNQQTLAAGTHTIKIQHKLDACSATWRSRVLVVKEVKDPILATSWVPTSESTSSTSFTDLTTLDQVTINMPSAGNVLIEYNSGATKNGCTGTMFNIVNIDGTDDANSRTLHSLSGGWNGPLNVGFKKSLSAGSHTIKIRHYSDSCSSTWYNRLLRVTRADFTDWASTFVATSETLSSSTYADLTTPDSATLVVPADSNLLVEYGSWGVTNCGGTAYSVVNLDGADYSPSISGGTNNGGWGNTSGAQAILPVTAGTHTVKIRHRVDMCSATWTARLLKLTTLPATQICDSGTLATTCTISSYKLLAANASITGSGNLVFASGAGIATIDGSAISINMGGDVTVPSGVSVSPGTISSLTAANFNVTGTFTGNITASSLGGFIMTSPGVVDGNVSINATTITIPSGATVKADVRGYAGGVGTGNGSGVGYGQGGGANQSAAGGGHGGAGGNGAFGPLGGAANDSLTNPVLMGSGGGADGVDGGAGGGIIRLVASGTATIQGTVSANGGSVGNWSGGGAGGTIVINATNLVASNSTTVIRANGGDAVGGAGGGGIIVISGDRLMPGVSVSGGTGGSNSGGAGSYTATFTGTANNAICDSGDLDTTCTVSGTKTLPNNYAITGTGNLIVASGGLIKNTTASGSLSFAMGGSITIQSGGSIQANVSSMTAVNVSIDSGGSFVADGLGHAGGGGIGSLNGYGTGPGIGSGNGGGGGGHGGAGGSAGGAGGATYGSATSPITFGSGGGGANNSNGGAGGGAIRINITGTLTVAGTLSANGVNGAFAAASWGSGGGAGGSIWITTGTIAGTGNIQAKGGDGGSNWNGNPLAGGGGGGRISITSARSFGGNITYTGGASAAYPGGLGTYYYSWTDANNGICTTGDLSSTCTISQPVLLTSGYAISGTGNIVVASGGVIKLANPSTFISIALGGDLTVQSGGSIQANVSSLTATNVSINSGGTFIADGLGSVGGIGSTGAGSGTGPGLGSTSGGGGGGYGGAGGSLGGAAGAGGATYGSATSPVDLGSGGGAGNGNAGGTGGAGGGAIKINITGTLTVAGTLSANGVAGGGASASWGGGGGSGGSIWIITGSIAGTGNIQAKGGNGGGNWNGNVAAGAGGGGRISITSARAFAGSVTVDGGSSSGAPGAIGTYSSTFSAGQDGICTTGDLSSTCTISQAVTLPSGYVISGSGSLVIASGGVLKATPSTASIPISLSGSLTVQSGGSIQMNVSSLTAVNVDINSGGTFTADGLGSAGGVGVAGNGTGTGPGLGSSSGGGGGGHGGAGGTLGGAAGTGGASYGSATSPVTVGSGGGSANAAVGGAGGGAIKINISGTLTVAGTLSANGMAGGFANASWGAGGGAGGSIWIVATSIAGTGNIQAKGGDGGGNWNGNPTAGGGGGGRISVTSARSFAGTYAFTGGVSTGVGSGANGTLTETWTDGVDGICTTGSLSGTCTISRTVTLQNAYAISGTGDLVVASGGLIKNYFYGSSISIAMGGNVTIQSGGSIQANVSSLTATNATISSGGSLIADALGGAGGTGNGNGSGTGFGTGSSSGGGGGGYGGAGGTSGGAGGSTYGTPTAPTDYGSGGGAANGGAGGAGGGAIKISVTGTLQVSGTLSANGAAGTLANCRGAGGGSGGSIWVVAGTLSGSGPVQARGGAGGGNGCGQAQSGGGGGGIIYISATTSTFAGSTDVSGGSGIAAGGAGIYNGPTSVAALNLDAALANGSAPYASGCAGTDLTWTNLTPSAGSNGTLSSFASCGATSGWNGTGVATDPYRLEFDGTNDYVSIARPVQDDFTIEVWLKTAATNGSSGQWYNGTGIVDGEVSGVTGDFGLVLLGSKAAFGTGSPDSTIATSASINDGNWHHIVATRTRSTGALKLIIDGDTAAAASGTGGTGTLTAPTNLSIGRMLPGGNPLRGAVGVVRLFNRVLSNTEIKNSCAADQARFNSTSCVP